MLKRSIVILAVLLYTGRAAVDKKSLVEELLYTKVISTVIIVHTWAAIDIPPARLGKCQAHQNCRHNVQHCRHEVDLFPLDSAEAMVTPAATTTTPVVVVMMSSVAWYRLVVFNHTACRQ